MSEPTGETPVDLPIIDPNRQFSAASIHDLARTLVLTDITIESTSRPEDVEARYRQIQEATGGLVMGRKVPADIFAEALVGAPIDVFSYLDEGSQLNPQPNRQS